MTPTDQDAINGLKAVDATYGRDNAMTVERLYRNECAHFKSQNYMNTLSPGMEVLWVHGLPIMEKPYGWDSLAAFWEENPQYAPTGTFKQVENTSGLAQGRGERVFIVFPTVEASMMTVAFRLNAMGWNAGAWFANAEYPDIQKKYSDYLLTIIPRFCLVNILNT